jgi:hypothetical protein
MWHPTTLHHLASPKGEGFQPFSGNTRENVTERHSKWLAVRSLITTESVSDDFINLRTQIRNLRPGLLDLSAALVELDRVLTQYTRA